MSGDWPLWLQAGLWGLLAGSALLVGAALGLALRLPQWAIAAVMAFGSGVLISALCFELMGRALAAGALGPAALGFAAGAAVYSLANRWLSRGGARHRKRSDESQPSEDEDSGSGAAIAVGTLLDGIPESIAIGLGLLAGGSVSLVTVAAIFISNIPEGLSSSAGMHRAGRPLAFILGLWLAVTALSGLAAAAGYALFGAWPPAAAMLVTGVAAGGIFAMVVETMIPEAFEGTRELAGLVAGAGFLAALALRWLDGG